MAEQHQQTEDQKVEQAFLTGFEAETAASGRPVPPHPEKAEVPVETKTETKPPETKPAPKEQGRQKPHDEFVRLTKPEYESLKTNAGKVPELEKRLETAFGKFGPTTQTLNELKATVEALKASTPKGEAVELPADVVSELEAEFPELAGGVKAALTKALKGLIGTGKSDANPEDVIKTRFEKLAAERAMEDLEEIHPKWREIVGAVDDPSKVDPTNPFRAWLAKQPAEYQAKVNNARTPTVIAKAIDKFRADERAAQASTTRKPVVKPQSKKVLLRKNRIQGSVQPKGLGAPPPAPKQTEEDAFATGFRSG